MRASVGRAGCALAATRARASVALAAHSWLVAAAAPLAARCASIGHACCARLLCEVRRRALRTRARARARAETGSGKGVRARGAYTRARLARRMTATMMASGPASGERTIMTVLPRLLREVRRRALRARTRAKRSLCAVRSSRTSRCTLKPHAQAARSGRTLKHCVCASVGGANLEDSKDRRCRSVCGVVPRMGCPGWDRCAERVSTSDEEARQPVVCLVWLSWVWWAWA